MKMCRFLVVLGLVAWLAAPAPAGIFFFKKHPKPNPATRVPELLNVLRSDPDEHKRAAAAQELRNFDPNAFPDIVPGLVAAVQSDPKPAVRQEAIQSLAKLRPVSQQAGQALEQAVENDSSMRVRLAARSALVQYHLSGYHAAKPNDPPADGPKVEEPPLAGAPGQPAAAPPVSPPPEPAPPAPATTGFRLFRKSGPRPLPVGPASPSAVPPPSGAEPPLAPPLNNEGPDLAPPK
jgi:hypothetical protein